MLPPLTAQMMLSPKKRLPQNATLGISPMAQSPQPWPAAPKQRSVAAAGVIAAGSSHVVHTSRTAKAQRNKKTEMS